MRVKLPSGLEVTVGCKHGETIEHGHLHRVTEVWVKDMEGNTIGRASAVCSLKDNFCKRTGRRLAAIRLLRRVSGPDFVTKESRRMIFATLCPEYGKKSAQPRP